ncbi:phosphatidate cytidylyltransferase [Pengzhenrongella sp.]|jgi:phosphatidate cytidylyltransferase|uniref:phosphatidate cytidylyltransferase n=1 Tax=Pengzhenrongella sp. TaxID=2888820 RepID=UPI002F92F582
MTELAHPAVPQVTRSGRDLPVATAVGLGLLAAVGASLFVRKEVFVGIAVIAVWASLWELDQALKRRDIHLPLFMLLVGSTGILVSAYVAGSEALLVAFMLTAGGLVVWRVLGLGDGPAALRDPTAALRDSTAGIFAAAYLPFLAGFVMLMLSMPDGALRVLLFVLLAVASDVGGYTAGVLIGRHPLAPSVSPKKTWEGLAGSVVLCCAVGAVGYRWLFGSNPLVGVALGLATVTTAIVGDLSESLIKRDLELKDMGSLLPGHGGVLDRLDSMLLTAPVVYLVLLVSLPVGD